MFLHPRRASKKDVISVYRALLNREPESDGVIEAHRSAGTLEAVLRNIRNSEEFVHRIESLPWFHSIDLGNGQVTPGLTHLVDLKAIADAVFDESLAGKTVLDIGCYDGFYSFEARRRGAKHVVATDHFIWQNRAAANVLILLGTSSPQRWRCTIWMFGT